MTTIESTKVKIQLFTDCRDPEEQLALDRELRNLLNRIGDRLNISGIAYTNHNGNCVCIQGSDLGDSALLICNVADNSGVVKGGCYTPAGPVTFPGLEL